MYALPMGLFDRFRPRRSETDPAPAAGPFRLSNEAEDRASLTLDLGGLPTDEVVEAAGEEPNGAFWEGVAHYVAPTIFRHLDFDSEGSMFAVEGERPDLDHLRSLLLPYVVDESAMRDLLERAHAAGITLEGYGT